MLGLPWRSFLLLLVGMIIVQGLAAWGNVDNLLTGQLPDTDPYMWLLRAEGLATGSQGWWDNSIPRMNAPYGDSSHWTHPLDIVLLAIAWPLHILIGLDWQSAIFWAGAVVPPLLYIIICFTAGWVLRPIVPTYVTMLGIVLVMLQPALMLFSMAGRPDHQHLILLAALLTFGFIVRALQNQNWQKATIYAGLSAAFGLWVSTEFQLTLILVTAGLALIWAMNGRKPVLQILTLLVIALSIFLFCALLIERGAGAALVERELDRLSILHIHALSSAALGLTILTTLLHLERASHSILARTFAGRSLLLAAVASLALMVITQTGATDILRGPSGDFMPRMISDFVQTTTEMRSAVALFQHSWQQAVLYLGFPILSALLGLYYLSFLSQRLKPEQVLVLVTFGGYLIFALLHFRFAVYAACFAVLALAVFYRPLHTRLSAWTKGQLLPSHWTTQSQEIAPACAHIILICLCFSWIFLSFLVYAEAKSVSVTTIQSVSTCRLSDIKDQLNQLPPGTILSQSDFSPALLYNTHHSAVAGPYHRNWQGMFDFLDFARGEMLTTAKILGRRKIDYILSCKLPVAESPYQFKLLSATTPLPAWLNELPLKNAGDWRLFSVNHEKLHYFLASPL
jgi:asparagine N-glycosylation enzyme membrane subunit Stt3